MITALLLNAGIDLVVGLALLLVWDAQRRQRFGRWLGASFVVQAASPLALLAWRFGPAPWEAAGYVTLVVTASTALLLWVIGAADLAGRPFSRRRIGIGIAALALTVALALGFQVRQAQWLGAVLCIAAGGVALVWLYRLGRFERIVGFAMALLGLNQAVWVLFDGEALPVQAPLAAILRVVLGMALLHVAVSRRGGDVDRLRDQFRDLVDRSHQGVAVMQGETMKYANPALLRIYGLPTDDPDHTAYAQRWRDSTMSESEREVARERHRRIVSGELVQDHWQGERTAFDGRTLHLRFSAWRVDWDGEPAEQIVVTDDTAQFDAIQTLLHRATHDELTGLPNRNALMQRLRELCSATPPRPFALLVLDIDRFKLFNEAHGPAVGDEVLCALAAGLARSVEASAEVMRLGEDEFALLAPNADPEAAAHDIAGQVRRLLAQPLVLQRHRFYLDGSIGAAVHGAHAETPESLLRAANAAVHEAKRMPGTSVQFAKGRFANRSSASLEIEQALRDGIEGAEFRLVYQPKVDASSHALVGFEALVRWDRPGVGRVEPNDFIPAAERTGLIGPLGDLILTMACRQLADWRDTRGAIVPVAVNVSPLQLLDPGFPQRVVLTLRKFAIPPRLLSLEITESAAVTHMAQARRQIRQMRGHGIGVALDDFGTGFSSLNMLRALPLSSVKIDRSLIEPMPAADAIAVVRAICDLAAALRLEVVAEGVETQGHASAALAAGCSVLQGYRYARPLEPAAAAEWPPVVAAQTV